MRRALITGLTGMDGSHLADLLHGKGYHVSGLVRRCSRPVIERIAHLEGCLDLYEGDLLDQASLDRTVAMAQPDEVYHLAAQSFVATSWKQPILTAEITGLGTLRMLEAVRHYAPDARFYQASSSEQFGNALSLGPSDEDTPFRPRSPYGSAKVFAHTTAVNYRESYGMHVSCGILFNHEGPRRGLEFVTRSITRQVAEMALGHRDQVRLGNVQAARDWGYAPDFVEAMWRMLQQDTPDDYVVATGVQHTVREFLAAALDVVGIALDDERHLLRDEALKRPAELHVLCGDATKARRELGWRPHTPFREMVRLMVLADLEALGGSEALTLAPAAA